MLTNSSLTKKRYDFSNIVDSQANTTNTNKSNTINQSIFINDTILSILSKQLNDLNLLTDISSNLGVKSDDDLLIIDDFTEQQQQQQQLNPQFTDILPR